MLNLRWLTSSQMRGRIRNAETCRQARERMQARHAAALTELRQAQDELRGTLGLEETLKKMREVDT